MNEFEREVAARVAANAGNEKLRAAAAAFMRESIAARYSYNFSILGRPIIQYPQDMMALQEIVWHVKPDLIIETGIAHGGSLVFSASLLALIDYCEAVEMGMLMDPSKPRRKVLGIDIDIRPANRAAILGHPLRTRIDMIQGSSIEASVVSEVWTRAKDAGKILVCLDSNHTHDHVLAELNSYAPLVTPGSYCVVFDSIVEDLPADSFSDRPWGVGNNPKTAVREFMRTLQEGPRPAADGAPLKFVVDTTVEHQTLLTVAPDGFLKRIT